jgi:hypothetical protein
LFTEIASFSSNMPGMERVGHVTERKQ